VRATITWKRCPNPYNERNLLAHELGHALGLDHTNQRCATMNFPMDAGGAGITCEMPVSERYRYYCRLLEADDIIGIVRRYGGTARFPTGPRVCTIGTPPLALGEVTYTSGFDEFFRTSITLNWTNPSGSTATGVGVLFKQDSCPTGPSDPLQFGRQELGYSPGPASATHAPMGSGTVCAYVQPFDHNGQPGPASTVTFTT
jgi:hypothetical protein